MKNNMPRSQTQPAPARHRFQHETPTVIHDPEKDMMLLARWFHRALQNPTRFWGTLALVVGGILGVVLIRNVGLMGSSAVGEAWARLESARSAADRLKVAEDYPDSPVATWARLQAATEYYNQGFADLPNNRDVALPTLKKALDQFDQVLREAPPDSPQARAAALGKARTLEARNELPKAIEQYRFVAQTWPGTPEAEQAARLAEALQRPDAIAFYRQLYEYSPTRVTLPPLGSQNAELPLVPAAPPSTTGGSSTSVFPEMPLLPPPPPRPIANDAPKPEPSDNVGGDQPAAPPEEPLTVPVLPEDSSSSDAAPARGEAQPPAEPPGSTPEPPVSPAEPQSPGAGDSAAP